jgi:hypothetical protein
MSKLNAGEVEIVLNDETRTLKPTIRAITGLSRQYGGLMKAVGLLRDGDIDAAANVISWGLGLTDKDARKMPEEVAKNGISDGLIVSLINFVGILSNGGKPMKESEEGADAEGGQGKE